MDIRKIAVWRMLDWRCHGCLAVFVHSGIMVAKSWQELVIGFNNKNLHRLAISI